MLNKKISLHLSLCLLFCVVISACGGAQNQAVAVAVALTQTAAAQAVAPTIAEPATEVPTAAPAAMITGTVNLQAPPTPAMTIFALNLETNEWFKTTTAASDSVGTFSIQVVPGFYVVFGEGIGYPSEDGWSLGTVTVAEGQTVSDIAVRLPSQSDCGSMFGTPAAPDGSFAAVDGPDPECKAMMLSGAASALLPDSATSSLMRISFAAGSTMSQIPGYIADSIGGHHYVLGASKGQTMTVNLYTDADAILVIWGNNGTALLTDASHAKSWSGTLPTTQDYYIDVRSMALTPVEYTLEVSISALSGTSSSQNSSNGIGNITGQLNYPDNYIPPMHLVAYNQDTGYWYWQGTAEGSLTYTLYELPAGNYTIVAYTQNGLIGSYASAGDGDLIPFEVKSGQTVTVNMTMWLDRNNPNFPASGDPVKW